MYRIVMVITNARPGGDALSTLAYCMHTRVHTHMHGNDHSHNTGKCAHRITSLQDPAKQINKLLIKRGKCDWPLTG